MNERVFGGDIASDLQGLTGHLPAQVRAKVARLSVEREAAWAGMRHVQEQGTDAYNAWKSAEANAKRTERFTIVADEDGRPTYMADDQEAFCSSRLQAYYDAWKRSNVNEPYLSEKWTSFAFLDEIRSWLSRGEEKNRRFKKHAPARAKGTDHIGAVEKLRAQIADVDGRIEGVEHAPATAAEIIERANAEVDRIAAFGALRINATDRSAPAVDLDWSPGRQSGGNFSAHQLLWVFKDDIKQKLAGLINAEVPPARAMTDADRTQELERLGEEKLGLERMEEAHIVAADDLGQFIARRRDADPRAILEVA